MGEEAGENHFAAKNSGLGRILCFRVGNISNLTFLIFIKHHYNGEFSSGCCKEQCSFVESFYWLSELLP